jgi:hypothetical protein
MPLFYFFTGILPVGGDQREFLIRLLPYIVISIVAFELLSRGTGYLFLSERFTMVRVWTYMMAALAVFTTKPLKFNVTPKGKSSVPPMAYVPQLTLLVLSILAPIWATIAYHQHWINYTAPGWGSMAFWMNGIWALWNCYFAFYVVRHSLAMKQQRDDHRFAEQLPVQVQVQGRSSFVPALTADLNPAGVGFRSAQRIEPGSKVTIQLPLVPTRVLTVGEVRHVAEEKTHLGTVYMHGVAFDTLPAKVRDTIELYCTQHSMPMWRIRYRQSIDILTRAGEVMSNFRGGRRRLVGLPAMVRTTTDGAPRTRMFILEDVSDSGARLIGDSLIPPGTSVSFTVPGTVVKGAGTVRHVQTLQTPLAVLFSLGVEYHHTSKRWLAGFRRASAPAVDRAPADVAAMISSGQGGGGTATI